MSMTIQQAGALARERGRQATVDYDDPDAQREALDMLRALIDANAVVGRGSQGDAAAATQYALRFLTRGEVPLDVDGFFDGRRSHHSTDLLGKVQRALGERYSKYRGTGPEAAGRNTFIAMYNQLAAPGATPLQLGPTPPEPRPGERQRQRAERAQRYEQLIAANPDRVVDEPRTAVAAPGAITNEETARLAVTAVAAADNPQRPDVLKRLGIAARAPTDGVDAPGVIRGGVAALTTGETAAVQRNILDFLKENAGQDNSAMLTALRATPQWAALRADAATRNFDGTGISAETWSHLAGPQPPASAPQDEQRTWRFLRFGQLNAQLAARTPLNRDDLKFIAEWGNADAMRFLVRGTPTDAVSVVRERLNALQPAEAAAFLTAIHGPQAPVPAYPDQEARRALVYGVLHDVFDRDGVTDQTRYNFFKALVDGESPGLVTMAPERFGPMMARIYATSTGSWFHSGSRYVSDLQTTLETRRAEYLQSITPQVPTR